MRVQAEAVYTSASKRFRSEKSVWLAWLGSRMRRVQLSWRSGPVAHDVALGGVPCHAVLGQRSLDERAAFWDVLSLRP